MSVRKWWRNPTAKEQKKDEKTTKNRQRERKKRAAITDKERNIISSLPYCCACHDVDVCVILRFSCFFSSFFFLLLFVLSLAFLVDALFCSCDVACASVWFCLLSAAHPVWRMVVFDSVRLCLRSSPKKLPSSFCSVVASPLLSLVVWSEKVLFVGLFLPLCFAQSRQDSSHTSQQNKRRRRRTGAVPTQSFTIVPSVLDETII